ncbi:hypothetical protein [Burkholderia multivorans]|uniref:hypothetical protein n=1 Tax=Burkholderia multivorans TaxID=87883 RepID=UPI0020A19F46|nr:hypothetical protein [Burkholderia multivorans]
MNGDTDQLSFVENSHFFVKRGNKVLTKPQQISYIQRHLREQTWCNFDLRVHDTVMEISEHRQWASISGTGTMQRNGIVLSQFDFLELWIIFDNRWQIVALCYDEKEREDSVTADKTPIA